MRGLKKLHKPRNNKNNEHISLFGKTSVGGNADTGSLTTTRLRNRLSVPCSGLLMWSVQWSAALLRTWPGCLIHSGLCVLACWCWKPPTPGIRGDTFYLPQAGKLNISFPQIKKKRKKKNQRNPGTRDSRGRRKLRKEAFWSVGIETPTSCAWKESGRMFEAEWEQNNCQMFSRMTETSRHQIGRLPGGYKEMGPLVLVQWMWLTINKQRVWCLTLCDSGQILAFSKATAQEWAVEWWLSLLSSERPQSVHAL